VPKSAGSLRPLPLRLLTLAIGSLALIWGFASLGRGAVADDLRELEARLLRFSTFSTAFAEGTLEHTAERDVSACDTHSQHALMLLEIPMADAALRSGDGHAYDRHVASLEARTRLVLGCSPRDSLAWLVAFGLQVQHGVLNEQSFRLLAMSYETSRDEAWIAVRRTAVAVPVLLSASPAVQSRILNEFENLVRHRFVQMPARAYVRASSATRILLDSRINKLDSASRREFSEAVEQGRS
jgi:hypothetical protein